MVFDFQDTHQAGGVPTWNEKLTDFSIKADGVVFSSMTLLENHLQKIY